MNPQLQAQVDAIKAKYNYKPPTPATSAPTVDWFTATAPKPAPKNVGELTADQYMQSGQKIVGSVTQAGERLAQDTAGGVGDIKGQLKGVRDVGEGVLGAGAGVVQGVFAPATALIQKFLSNADEVRKQAAIKGEPTATLTSGQQQALEATRKQVTDWAQANPRLATDLMDAITVGTTAIGGEAGILGKTASKMTVGEGANAFKQTAVDLAQGTKNAAVNTATGVKNAAVATKNAVVNPIETTKSVIAKSLYGSDADKITASLKNSYSKVPLPKGVMQEEAQTGKSFADFMSQKPYLSMPVKDAKWDTYGTAQTLREEAKPEAQALQNLLDSSHAMVSEQKLVDEMKSAVESVATGQDRTGVQQFIDRELPTLVDQMGGKTAIGPNGERMISVSGANKVKQALWNRSPFSPTASRADKLKSSVDYKMGQVIRKNIEGAVDDADIQSLNGELGDYYHAIETLENLHGGAAPGGKIGSLFTKVAGTVAGSPGGAIGSIAGYMTADKISELMMNPAITTAIKREALMQLKVQRPTVANKVADILKQREAEAMTRPKLPAPSAIYMPPSKGVVSPSAKIATERAAAGETTEMPQEQIHQYIDILGRSSN